MKQIRVFFLSIAVLLLSACTNKNDIKKEPITPKLAMVYIYVSAYESHSQEIVNDRYEIHVNGKVIDTKIKKNEYLVFSLNPVQTIFSASRAQVDESSLTLDLQPQKTYYLRVKIDSDNSGFEFEEVKSSVGMQEIVKTSLPSFKEELKYEQLNDNNETNITMQPTLSKTQKIVNAFKLKEQGIISDSDYEKLKTKILAK